MCIVRGSHFWQLGSIAFLAETTGGEILVDSDQKWSQKQSQSAKFQKFSWESMLPDLPSLFTHKRILIPHLNGHTSLK